MQNLKNSDFNTVTATGFYDYDNLQQASNYPSTFDRYKAGVVLVIRGQQIAIQTETEIKIAARYSVSESWDEL